MTSASLPAGARSAPPTAAVERAESDADPPGQTLGWMLVAQLGGGVGLIAGALLMTLSDMPLVMLIVFSSIVGGMSVLLDKPQRAAGRAILAAACLGTLPLHYVAFSQPLHTPAFGSAGGFCNTARLQSLALIWGLSTAITIAMCAVAALLGHWLLERLDRREDLALGSRAGRLLRTGLGALLVTLGLASALRTVTATPMEDALLTGPKLASLAPAQSVGDSRQQVDPVRFSELLNYKYPFYLRRYCELGHCFAYLHRATPEPPPAEGELPYPHSEDLQGELSASSARVMAGVELTLHHQAAAGVFVLSAAGKTKQLWRDDDLSPVQWLPRSSLGLALRPPWRFGLLGLALLPLFAIRLRRRSQLARLRQRLLAAREASSVAGGWILYDADGHASAPLRSSQDTPPGPVLVELPSAAQDYRGGREPVPTIHPGTRADALSELRTRRGQQDLQFTAAMLLLSMPALAVLIASLIH